MITEAALWTRGEDGRALCGLCAHRCSVAPGRWGVCGVRENRAGSARHPRLRPRRRRGRRPDREEAPLPLPSRHDLLLGRDGRLQLPAAASARTGASRSFGPRTARPEGRPLPPERIAALALENGCASVSYTYTEPTIFFEYARDAALPARAAGLANVFVSNGYMTAEAAEASRPWLDAANIDLKAFRDETYRKVCGARLQPVLETIERLRAAGVWIEVTTLIVPGMNDGEDELADIARFLASLDRDIPWHISRFHPDYEITDRPVTPSATLAGAAAIGRAEGLRFIYVGNAPGEGDATACPVCGLVLVRRVGLRRPGEPPRRRRALPRLPHAHPRPLVLPRGQATLK